MPFAGYDDFEACVVANSNKDDPDAYCAAIMRDVEGKSADEYIEDTLVLLAEKGVDPTEGLVRRMGLRAKMLEAKGNWVPYAGPQGGEGWKNVETGDVEYTDSPPGETISADDLTDEQISAVAEGAGMSTGEVRKVLDDNGEVDQPDTEVDMPLSPDEAGREAARAIIDEYRSRPDKSVDSMPSEDELAEVWEDRFEGAFEDLDEDVIDSVDEATQQVRENEDFQELLEATGVELNPVPADVKGMEYVRGEPQAQRMGGMSVIFDTPLGTTNTEPETPTPDDAVSSSDVASILRHEAAHDMYDRLPRETREEFVTQLLPEIDETDISGYAGDNPEEAFTELITVATHPKFDEDNYPNEVVELAERMKQELMKVGSDTKQKGVWWDGLEPTDNVDHKAGQWIPYTGPRGGEGWKNAETGEVVYQSDPPGEAATSDPEDDPLTEGNHAILQYDGHTTAAEVVAELPSGQVKVHDDRGNTWDIDPDSSSQYDGKMEVANLGSGESDKRDPAELTPDNPDDLKYAIEEQQPEDAVGSIIEAADHMEEDEIVDAVEDSGLSLLLASSEIERLHTSSASSEGTVAADPDRSEAREHRRSMIERLEDESPYRPHEIEEQKETLDGVKDGWQGHMYQDPKTAPLVQAAIENTGNDNIPEWRGAERTSNIDVPEHKEDAVERLSEYTTEQLREAFGDEIVVARGLSSNPHGGTPSSGTSLPRKLKRAKEEGEDVQIEHRPVESWTLSRDAASLYGDVIITREIDVEDVAMSSSTGGLDAIEDDTVVQHEGTAEYDPDDILTMDGDEDRFKLALRLARGMQK